MIPRVSIVIASYNYGRYIGEALNSVRAQTVEDWEAIVVDDGSADNSIAVIESYLADGRFRLIRQDHAGQARAKNRGIRSARGHWIAFLDADDRWRADKLEKQLAVCERQPQLGVIYSRRRLIDPAGRIAGGDDRAMHRGRILNFIYRDNFVCFTSAMVNRRAIECVGLFDERINLAIDYDWWLRLARHYDFDYVDEPLVDYRTGHANLSRRVGERLDVALEIMARFRRDHDVPPLLDPEIAKISLAETYRHRGLVCRQEKVSGTFWLLRSLAVRPAEPQTWRALAGSCAPAKVRQLWRQLRGKPNWEEALVPAKAA